MQQEEYVVPESPSSAVIASPGSHMSFSFVKLSNQKGLVNQVNLKQNKPKVQALWVKLGGNIWQGDPIFRQSLSYQNTSFRMAVEDKKF